MAAIQPYCNVWHEMQTGDFQGITAPVIAEAKATATITLTGFPAGKKIPVLKAVKEILGAEMIAENVSI